MSMVHGSGGINMPASKELRSEVAIIAGMAAATVGSAHVDWAAMADDYDLIRDLIARVLPAFGDYNTEVRKPRGFWLRNPASEREFNTSTGLANFSPDPLPDLTEWQQAERGEGLLVLQTFRSHDQYNTTIYGMDDRYRGVYGERRVIFINPADLARLGRGAGDMVDLTSHAADGALRHAGGFRLVPYEIPQGCIAGYYPELNLLVPHDAWGEGSFTPVSKSILVSLRPAQQAA